MLGFRRRAGAAELIAAPFQERQQHSPVGLQPRVGEFEGERRRGQPASRHVRPALNPCRAVAHDRGPDGVRISDRSGGRDGAVEIAGKIAVEEGMRGSDVGRPDTGPADEDHRDRGQEDRSTAARNHWACPSGLDA
jgi:hypothetical protein